MTLRQLIMPLSGDNRKRDGKLPKMPRRIRNYREPRLGYKAADIQRERTRMHTFIIRFSVLLGVMIVALVILIWAGEPVGVASLAERVLTAIGEAGADSLGDA